MRPKKLNKNYSMFAMMFSDWVCTGFKENTILNPYTFKLFKVISIGGEWNSKQQQQLLLTK